MLCKDTKKFREASCNVKVFLLYVFFTRKEYTITFIS